MKRSTPEAVESESFELAVSTSHLLHRAQQLAVDRFALLVADPTLTLRQFTLLAAIAKTPGLSQAELVRATGIDRSTLADMMPRLEKRGWVERTASEDDLRANEVRLAQTGAETLKNARHAAAAADAAILDALPKSKRHAFLEALKKLSKFSDKEQQREEQERRKEQRKQARADAKAQAAAARAAAHPGKRKRKRKARAEAAKQKRSKKQTTAA